jgi:hypothetical protein
VRAPATSKLDTSELLVLEWHCALTDKVDPALEAAENHLERRLSSTPWLELFSATGRR